ncbi:protease PrsW [Alteromonas aestuariivivens]|uniref:Protease PrsW n=1 Tax=Alteromonas aestuariivivens TaxID=1938339 RepID=A0A3D8M384_9ALTE|nr:PrsW family intramembrane metalloprotease [Alteromonas aestuariivivens]RDV24088.1 protease PrsW [Alteromonas aestuariivivens]
MNRIWILLIAAPFVVAAIIVNFAFHSKSLPIIEQARNTALAGNHTRAEKLYDDLLKADPLNIELHRLKIRTHFNIPEKTGKHSYRDDKTILAQYQTMAQSSDPKKSDIGYYALGYIEIMQSRVEEALDSYLRVQNQELKYLNNSIGYVYMTKHNYEDAEVYFQTEINVNGNVSGAYSNLAKVYQHTDQSDKFATLLSNPDAKPYISDTVIRHFLYEDGDFRYTKYAFQIGDFTTTGLVGAILILLSWLVFLLWIDVYEKEKLRHVFIAVVLGCGFSMLCTPLYDFYHLTLGWARNGNYLNDLLYCIFAIGVVEETVKILPFLILLRFKHIINESMDYIVYASITALGFAFMENLLYFHESGLENILSRSLSASVLHMTLTSFVAYGLMYAKYKGSGANWVYFLGSFSAACVIHGLYDFWILSDGWVGELRILSVLILFYAIQRYAIAIANALSHSEFSVGEGKLVRSAEYLGVALTCIAAYQYTVIGYKFGAENANLNLFSMLLSSAFLAYILVNILGKIQVSSGNWTSIITAKR